MQTPLILQSDSYKFGHWLIQPENTEYMSSYVASRGGFQDYTEFFGIQIFLKKLLTQKITKADVFKAKALIDAHIGPGIFNFKGWMKIVNVYDGKLPVKIYALKEGTILPGKMPLVRIENTDPDLAFLVGYLETPMLRDIWYGTTVATVSLAMKKTIMEKLKLTSDDPEGAIDFMLHDFGYRGVSSDESAQMGALAHMINFQGTDTVAGLIAAMEYYNAEGPVGFSVLASEHSVTCALSDAENRDDFAAAEKMVTLLENRVKETGEFQIVSAVADTYDVFRFTEEYIGTRLKDRIVNSGGRFVVRPDSGDANTIPVQLVEILLDKFGYEVNEKGYKVLPSCIRVLQGDGINDQTIKNILGLAMTKNIAAENFVFGSGGGLLQHADRDWLKFAMKCSAVQENGVWKDVFKDPITDQGKTSLKGRVTTVINQNGEYECKRLENVLDTDEDQLQLVFENGEILFEQTFEEVRQRAKDTMKFVI